MIAYKRHLLGRNKRLRCSKCGKFMQQPDAYIDILGTGDDGLKLSHDGKVTAVCRIVAYGCCSGAFGTTFDVSMDLFQQCKEHILAGAGHKLFLRSERVDLNLDNVTVKVILECTCGIWKPDGTVRLQEDRWCAAGEFVKPMKVFAEISAKEN